jgi:hypothetical protein
LGSILSASLKNRRQITCVFGGKVDDNDEGNAAVSRHPLEKQLEGAYAAGRGADADDGTKRLQRDFL